MSEYQLSMCWTASTRSPRHTYCMLHHELGMCESWRCGSMSGTPRLGFPVTSFNMHMAVWLVTDSICICRKRTDFMQRQKNWRRSRRNMKWRCTSWRQNRESKQRLKIWTSGVCVYLMSRNGGCDYSGIDTCIVMAVQIRVWSESWTRTCHCGMMTWEWRKSVEFLKNVNRSNK